MNIIFYDAFHTQWPENIQQLQEQFKAHQFVKVDTDSLQDHLPTLDAIVTWHLNAAHVKKAENLQVIFTPFTGVNLFPFALLRKKNIILANNHGASSWLAERALALALTLMGRIIEYHNDLCKGVWHNNFQKQEFWSSLQGKRCGILGMGHTGRHLASLLTPFGGHIIGYRLHCDQELPNVFDRQTSVLEDVIAESDVIFVCLPLTVQTSGLLSGELLKTMHGKYLINVGRGPIIEEKGLYDALEQGILAGVALDVHYCYPRVPGQIRKPSRYNLEKFYNVVLSSHVGSHTLGAHQREVDDTITNITSYLTTGIPQYYIPLERMY